MLFFSLIVNILLGVVLADTEPTCRIVERHKVCDVDGVLVEVTAERIQLVLKLEYLNLVSIQPGAFKNLTIKDLWFTMGNQISTLEPASFTGFTRLSTLRLDRNLVKLIPNLFEEVPTLSKLQLTYNSITNIPDGSFNGLSSLSDLQLNNNDITAINRNTFDGLTSLTVLRLQENEIETIAAGAFVDLTALTHLVLNFNNLAELDPESLESTSVEFLFLNDNQLTSIQPYTFASIPALLSLQLRNNKITTIYANAFAGLSQLDALHLSGNEISNIQAGAFNGLDSLQLLQLDNNNVYTLSTGLFSGINDLLELHLRGNPLAEFDRQQLEIVDTAEVYLDEPEDQNDK